MNIYICIYVYIYMFIYIYIFRLYAFYMIFYGFSLILLIFEGYSRIRSCIYVCMCINVFIIGNASKTNEIARISLPGVFFLPPPPLGSCGPPWAIVGRALVGPPGPLWAPLGHCGPGPCGLPGLCGPGPYGPPLPHILNPVRR